MDADNRATRHDGHQTEETGYNTRSEDTSATTAGPDASLSDLSDQSGSRAATDESMTAARNNPPSSRDTPVAKTSARSITKRNARPATGQAPAGSIRDDGADLERRVARLEFAEGALARLRVPVFVDAEAGRGQLTDLDVLALDFDNRLRLSRSTLECKSGGGQSGEGDRLLW